MLLCTEGLVERRGTGLDDGPDSAEDDIALLVVRAHPEHRLRPDGTGVTCAE